MKYALEKVQVSLLQEKEASTGNVRVRPIGTEFSFKGFELSPNPDIVMKHDATVTIELVNMRAKDRAAWERFKADFEAWINEEFPK